MVRLITEKKTTKSSTSNHSRIVSNEWRASLNVTTYLVIHIPTRFLKVSCIYMPIKCHFCVSGITTREVGSKIPHSAINGLPRATKLKLKTILKTSKGKLS